MGIIQEKQLWWLLFETSFLEPRKMLILNVEDCMIDDDSFGHKEKGTAVTFVHWCVLCNKK